MSESFITENQSEPTRPDRTTGLCSRVLFVTALIFSALAIAEMFHSRDVILPIFQDFDTPLPSMTLIVISPVFLWMLPVLFLLCILRECLLRNPRAKLIGNVAQLCLAIVLWAVYTCAMRIPLMNLTRSLGS